MVRETALFVLWRTTSCGSAWNGGFPLGASITQLSDMLAIEVIHYGEDDCVATIRVMVYTLERWNLDLNVRACLRMINLIEWSIPNDTKDMP